MFKEPKDFNATLISRVRQGIAHVINYKEYAQLPASLKRMYYPLFNRMDTTYRLQQRFMRARRDIDQTTISPTIVRHRAVIMSRQRTQEPVQEFQPAGDLVVASPATSKTPMSKKTMTEIIQETRLTLAHPPKVSARFSRY